MQKADDSGDPAYQVLGAKARWKEADMIASWTLLL